MASLGQDPGRPRICVATPPVNAAETCETSKVFATAVPEKTPTNLGEIFQSSLTVTTTSGPSTSLLSINVSLGRSRQDVEFTEKGLLARTTARETCSE